MRPMLESLVDIPLIRDTPYDQEIAGEPGSDDFHTYFTTAQSETRLLIGQITWYAEIRDTRFHSKDFWLNTPLEVQQSKKLHFVSSTISQPQRPWRGVSPFLG
jgi:hypothetical protein